MIDKSGNAAGGGPIETQFILFDCHKTTLKSYREALETPLEISQVLKLAIDVAEAFAFLEENGVVYMDLKPDNVVVSEGGRVVLIDFGAALRVDNEADFAVTRRIDDLPPYNSGYAAPEVVSARREASEVATLPLKGQVKMWLLRLFRDCDTQ